MPGLIGPDDFRKVAEPALDLKGTDGVEVLFMHEWGGLTRFASSSIHQSTWREDTAIRVRVATDGRVGVASTNDFSKDGTRKAATSAFEMATVAAPDPMFPGLAPKAATAALDTYDEATAETTPTARAENVAALIGEVGAGFRAAGAYDTTALEVGLANTEGQFCYQPYTQASLTTVVSGGDGGAGACERTASRRASIDPHEIGRDAFRRAKESQAPRDVEPGVYEVILEPLAVSTLLGFLSYVGFGGRAIAEGRSPFSGKESGEQVASDSVSIVDDALDPDSIGLAFDFEGTPKRRVPLIEKGRFVQGVHDRRSAKQAGVESTGHGLPAPNPEGAFPLNLVMSPGEATLDDMIAATGRGLLVTRFHYSNIVHPIETVITGMTRDGTWLIEDGRIIGPVKNLRFTQSILKALSDVRMVGRERVIAGEFFFAASLVPALSIGAFNFSGKSDH